eukprot:3610797-Rhodomonas_salina.1
MAALPAVLVTVLPCMTVAQPFMLAVPLFVLPLAASAASAVENAAFLADPAPIYGDATDI